MTRPREERVDPPQQQLYCRTCKEEFAAYKSEMTAQCPRCGRTIRMPLHRHYLRLVAVGILAGLAIAVVIRLVFF